MDNQIPSHAISMSPFQATMLALLPGQAETLEHIANCRGNMGWAGMAMGVRYARNALYVGTALTTLATIGMRKSDGVMKCMSGAVCVLGAGLTVGSAKKLYDSTSFVRDCFNKGYRP